MVFGRKKKPEQDVAEHAATNQEEDLAVAYGNVDEVKDDVSLTESIPPPPPSGEVSAAKNEDQSQEDSPTESPSVGANDDPDDLVDEKTDAQKIKRKKMLLVVSFVVTFCVLLGLAIKYGQVRSQSSTIEVESDSAASSEAVSISTSPPTLEDVETPAPTNATVVEELGPFAGCIANDVSVITTCDDGGAVVTFEFCLIDEMTDQFWEWVSTPQGTPQIIANDWGWLRDGEVAEFPFILADGAYEIGLFSNGEEQLREYPILNSTVFTVDCTE